MTLGVHWDCRHQAAPQPSLTAAWSLQGFRAQDLGAQRADLYWACTLRPGAPGVAVAEGLEDHANFALHVPDEAALVRARRCELAKRLACGNIQWLDQQHTARVLALEQLDSTVAPVADGVLVQQVDAAAAVVTADCLPVVLWLDEPAAAFAILHVGWRGLLGGILSTGVSALRSLGPAAARVCGWLGPHSCAAHYEVDEVLVRSFEREGFPSAALTAALRPSPRAKHKRHLSLATLALTQLSVLGVDATVSPLCSYGNPAFYSHRHAQHLGFSGTGRFATVAWRRG